MPSVPFVPPVKVVSESMHYLPGDRVYYRFSGNKLAIGIIQGPIKGSKLLVKNQESGKEQACLKSDIIQKA